MLPVSLSGCLCCISRQAGRVDSAINERQSRLYAGSNGRYVLTVWYVRETVGAPRDILALVT